MVSSQNVKNLWWIHHWTRLAWFALGSHIDPNRTRKTNLTFFLSRQWGKTTWYFCCFRRINHEWLPETSWYPNYVPTHLISTILLWNHVARVQSIKFQLYCQFPLCDKKIDVNMQINQWHLIAWVQIPIVHSCACRVHWLIRVRFDLF